MKETGMELEQIFKDASKLQAFRKELFEQVATNYEYGCMNYQSAIITAKNLIMTRQFKNVPSLQKLAKKIPEAWWKEFQHSVQFRQQKLLLIQPTQKSTDFELTNERIEGENSPNEFEEELKTFNLKTVSQPIGFGQKISASQKFDLYQFKVQNPTKTYFEISKIFSQKFQVQFELFFKCLRLIDHIL